MKAYVYLRRSKGEKGTTADQMKRIQPILDRLEKERGIIVDRRINGLDLKGKRRGPKYVEGAGIWNEGNGKSAFGLIDERPVFVELMKQMKKGDVDVVYAESLDRFSRDPIEIGGSSMLRMYRDEGKSFLSLTNDAGFRPDDLLGEAVAITSLLWGGYAKKEEIKKAEKARTGSALDTGFFKGSKPEFIGYKAGKSEPVDYRRLWEIATAYGEDSDGRLRSPSTIAREFKRDHKWVTNWYYRMRGYDETGVLEDWLTVYESINDFIFNQEGRYAVDKFKKPQVKRILKAATGWLGYPAGVNPSGTSEFVTFPNPVKIGLENLASVENPMELPEWEVKREPLGKKKLHPIQTQPRSKK